VRALDLQLHAALKGDFEKEERDALRRIERALGAAMKDWGQEVQSRWRSDILQSGLRNAGRMSKTIRTRTYANGGLDPAVVVRSSYPLLQKAFEDAPVVQSSHGLWLTIPNPEVWPDGRVRRSGGRGQARQTSVAIAERRFGPLRFIYNPKGASMLVTDARRSRKRDGTFRFASPTAKRRGNVEQIVVFFLVKSARLPRMLRGRVIRDRAKRDSAREIDKRFIRYFEQDDAPRLLTDQSGGAE